MSYFAILISALLGYFLIVNMLTSCSKEDHIATPYEEILPTNNYVLFDYQDSLRIAYAMRTDLYTCNNISFQLKEGGRLDLYSHQHLDPSLLSDTAKLISYEAYADNQNGVVAVITTELFPYGTYISRGKITIKRVDEQYTIDILGANENGLGFRSQFRGCVHDLTAATHQGSLNFDEDTISFRLGIMSQAEGLRTYRLIGSNPYAECAITSTVDIAGKSLPISSNPADIESGRAVGLTASIPYGIHSTGLSGTLHCSNYDGIYTLVISATTNRGEASGHFTGPLYTE